MDGYLTLLTTARSMLPPQQEYKLSARRHHRKQRNKTAIATGKDSPLRSQTARHSSHDAFRSVAVLGEVMRLESDVNQAKMQPEEAFALLRRLLSPSDLVVLEDDDELLLSLSELLDGIEAACWRTLAAEQDASIDNGGYSSGELTSTMMTEGGGASPQTLRCQVHRAYNMDSPRRESHLYEPDSSLDGATDPIRLRYSHLHCGVQVVILERQRALESLKCKLQQVIQHNSELPSIIKGREAAIQKLKETFMAGASKKLDCDGGAITTIKQTMAK